MADHRSVLLAGVGGQGAVMASIVLAETLVAAGCDVKQSEVHGMAQRGGSVVSHVRFGPSVASPVIPMGEADVLVAFEWAEALRWLGYVRPGGTVIVDMQRVMPPMAQRDRKQWVDAYPDLDAASVRDLVGAALLVDATGIASELGNHKAANSVLLGALAARLDVPLDLWKQSIAARVPPKTVDLNLAAFERGLQTTGDERPTALELPHQPTATPHHSTIEVTADWCKGCNICVRVCPEYCLALNGDLKAFAGDPELCTGCGLCQALCPDFAITVSTLADDPALVRSGGGPV